LHALLNQPAVQGGIAPFVAALIAAELFRRLRLSGLAVTAGFITTVYLVSGFSFEPLTAVRKIILLGLVSSLFAVAISLLYAPWLRTVLAAVGGAASLWMAQRILVLQPTPIGLMWSAGCMFYTGWLVFWMDDLHGAPIRAGSAGLALGLGTGIAALFGSSVLLGHFGMSMGAASAAYLVIQVVTNHHLSCGRSFTLPLSLIAGLTGCLGVLSAQLPWYALIPLGAVPLVARISVSEKSGLWLQSMVLSLTAMICAAFSVYLTWRVAGAPPL
jgi:hypothetical protein